MLIFLHLTAWRLLQHKKKKIVIKGICYLLVILCQIQNARISHVW